MNVCAIKDVCFVSIRAFVPVESQYHCEAAMRMSGTQENEQEQKCIKWN